jgi:hypothetical protein
VTVEHDLSARLSALADELTWLDPAVSAEAAVARHRRQRRARAGMLAAVAAVVALVVAVPTAIGTLSASPEDAAGPAPTTSTPSIIGTSSPVPITVLPPDDAVAQQAAEEAAEGAAAAGAAQQAAQSELSSLAVEIGTPVPLSSPAEWDQWLPEGKPYPGASTEEDIATCPRLADRLGAAFGMRFSYWTGTLPQGPSGCTWVPVPLSYDGPYDYAYLFDVGFVGDGRTVDDLRRTSFVMGGAQDEYPGATPCPWIEVPGGGALIRCAGGGQYDAAWTLVLPDARGAGVWTVSASAQPETGTTSAEALTVLVDSLAAVYG